MRNFRVQTLVLLLVAACIATAFVLRRRRLYPALPYRDSFAKHEVAEWMPMGGYWGVNQDEVINRSDEPGAKLVTGSPKWTDYEVDADLELRAHGGDVGLALRVNEPQIGINAYRGYYVGMRSVDSAVVIGRADNDWIEGRPVPMNGGVQIGTWYHVKAIVQGCEIAVEATNLNEHRATFAAFRDDPHGCIPAGKIGLRSTDTSGAWKNVQVKAASTADLDALLQQVAFVARPEFPIREADYSRMRMKYFPDYPHLVRDAPADAWAAISALPFETVQSLQTRGSIGKQVRIQGLATFTDPIYLQDATGGILLRVSNPESVNIGDELGVVGQIVAGGFNPVFAASDMHLLREGTAASPVSITATEAASGAHAGTLVEVTGVVEKRSKLTNGEVFLELKDPAQRFAAVLKSDLFNGASEDWTPGSTIRVRGICTVNPEAASGRSFIILIASASDVNMIAGPPWWSGWRLARIAGLFLLAIAAGIYMFFRFELSKNRAIMQEREQLAHEMHDTLAQSFAGVGYYLQSIRRSLRGVSQFPIEVSNQLDVACEMVTNTHREASASIASLHPEGNNDGDLLSLLQHSTFLMLGGERIPITLRREGSPRSISPIVKDVLFHVGREAISNVLRHSAATEMTLRLRFQPKLISFAVEDNGVGFDVDSSRDGFGIQAMRRRCTMIGAVLTIRSVPGDGCTMAVDAPNREHTAAKWLRALFRLS